MANSKASRRSVSTAQLRMREMDIFVTGDTATGPVTPLGFDRFGVTIEKNGTGDYTVFILSAYGRDDIMGWVSMVDAPGMSQISAVTRNSIRILTFDPAGAGSDRDFMLRILGSEFNYDI